MVTSHAGTPGSTITQLAFSPRENLLAWTDTEGIFSRWLSPVPNTFPDPVKASIVTNATAPVQGKQKTGLNLFIDEPVADVDTLLGISGGEVDLDADLDEGPKLGDMDDDWIIDDIGGGAMDDPVGGSGGEKGGYVKEMGRCFHNTLLAMVIQLFYSQLASRGHNRRSSLVQRQWRIGSDIWVCAYLVSTFLCQLSYLPAYNTLGVIEVTDQDTHHIVNVEFFDRSARKGYHFTDRYKYHLGYLGKFTCTCIHCVVIIAVINAKTTRRTWRCLCVSS